MNLPKQLNFTRFAALFLAVTVVAACDDDATGPNGSGELDPVQTASTVEDVADRFFANNTGVQSLNSLSDEIFTVLGSPSIAAYASIPNPKEAIGTSPRLRQQAEALRQAAIEGVELNIPQGLLGNTLVFDPELDRYVIDSERTGAPENGVRFILYAINQATGKPLSPPSENEIGHVDLIDESDFPTVSVTMIVVAEGQTLVDVTATGTADEATQTFTLTFDGFIGDGTDTLEFELSLSASETTFSVALSLNAAGLELDLTFSGENESDAGDITLSILDTSTQDILVFDLSTDANDNLDGSITLNGVEVAIISGTFENPVITNGEGDPLTDEDLEALEDLFEAMGSIFEVFLELINIALFLLFLGTV